MGPTLTLPPGTVGLPDDIKETGQRIDFRPDGFTLAIETKSFGRLAWTQACYCPCAPINDQTEQPDPNCSLCEGHGWLMFRPHLSVIDPAIIGDLDPLQTKLLDQNNGSIIMGIMSSFTGKESPYEAARRRVEGTANLTVRAENKLGYWDRIVNLDALIPYSQIADADGTDTLPLTYPAVQVHLLRTVGAILTQGEATDPQDFYLDVGEIKLTVPPAEGVRYAIHYLCHPTWRVIDHPHTTRVTPVKFKTSSAKGVQTPLPVQAVVRYEFLPST